MRGARGHESKGLEKFLKKVLDKESAVWYNLDPAAERRVPCKLNNVKKKHEAPEEDRVLFSLKRLRRALDEISLKLGRASIR